MSTTLEELFKRPVEDRLEAIDALWDSIDADNVEIELSDEDRAELDRRLDEAEKNPGVGCSWEELKARLKVH